MRFSRQRELIYRAVCDDLSHPTAEEVYAFLKPLYPSLSLATVYRNLNQLTQSGRLLYLPVPNAPGCYDSTLRQHYHMICRQCSHLYDIDVSVLPALDRIVSERTAHTVDSHLVLFYGTCAVCKKENKGD